LAPRGPSERGGFPPARYRIFGHIHSWKNLALFIYL
jgi:hypothetical protein